MATGTMPQADEIASLKVNFQGQVKVIKDIGDFTNVVTLIPSDTRLQVKFQLTNDYPNTIPTLSVRCDNCETDLVTRLTAHLTDEANKHLGQPMMSDLIGECLNWVSDNGVDISCGSKQKKTDKKAGKAKQTGKKKSEEEPDKFVKKPPMKTAADVIKRLQWDKGIDKEMFIVGYMDRLTGLEEKPFTMFTWEDLASVDQFCLAIPQHRIQYFKYKEEKVWDKNERLDNFFGSTGSQVTIVEAVQKYEDRHKSLHNEEQDTIAMATTGANYTLPCAEQNLDTEVSEGQFNMLSLSSQDQQQQQHQFQQQQEPQQQEPQQLQQLQQEQQYQFQQQQLQQLQQEQQYQFQQQQLQQLQQEQSYQFQQQQLQQLQQEQQYQFQQQQLQQQQVPQQQRSRQNKRFNFFTAIEITDKQLAKTLTKFQDTFIKIYPQYEEHREKKNGFHLTLNALYLDGPADIATCQQIMEELHPEIEAMARVAGKLIVAELDQFFPRIIYAKVKCPPELRKIANTITDALKKKGFEVDPLRTPHLTLFNVSQSAFRHPSWQRENINLHRLGGKHFGEQSLNNIQICKMGTLPSEEEATEASSFYRNVVKFVIN